MPRKYTHYLRVRHSDTDSVGVVNNIAFFYYMEAARFEFWRSRKLTLQQLQKRGLTFAVAKQCCEYQAPVYHDDWLAVTVSVQEIGSTSFTLSYQMRVKKKRVADGEIVLVCIEQSTRQPIPLPRFLIKKLSA